MTDSPLLVPVVITDRRAEWAQLLPEWERARTREMYAAQSAATRAGAPARPAPLQSLRNVIAAGLVLVALAGCSRGAQGGPPLVFVCETDGELTEEHYGVADAWSESHQRLVWTIAYTDGKRAYYRQNEGETCYTEEAAQ